MKTTRSAGLTLCFLLLLLSAFATPGWAAKKKAKTAASKTEVNPNEVVAKIGDESITVRELEEAFKKTSPATVNFSTLPFDSLKNFIDLYCNYRMKLKYAADTRLDDDPDVVKELEQNRRAFAGPYLIERLVTEPNVKLMYERRKSEYLVQQVQVAFPPSKMGQPAPADTLRAYTKARNILAMIQGGADFTKLAEDSSDEPTAKKTHGILHWLTAGQTPKTFEDAVYSLKPGAVYPEPVRTPYGYFVIKVLEEKKNTGGVRVYQILLSVASGAPRQDTLAKYALADSLLYLLKHGKAEFSDLVSKFSNDKTSNQNGGDIGYHTRGDKALPQEVQDAVFNISDDELAPRIVRTLYGYHIIKRGDSKPIGSYEDEKENLKTIYKKYFFPDDYNAFLASLRAKYNFAFSQSALSDFYAKVDTVHTTADSNWDKRISPDLRAQTLYTLRGVPVTVGAMIDTLKTRPDLKGTALNNNGFTSFIYKLIEPRILEFASEHIEERYPEFKNLMMDVKDGILIYRLEQQEVWNKLQAQMTDSAVKAYWEPRQAQYVTAPRVDISEIYTVADTLAKAVYAKAMAGMNFDTLAKKNTLRAGYKDKNGHWGIYAAGDNPLAAKVIDKDSGYITPPFAYENGFSIVRVNAKIPPRPKEFKDAIPDAASQYQEYLSKKIMADWIASMRVRYPVKIYDDVLKRIVSAGN